MNHELTPKPEDVYDDYTKAYATAEVMKEVLEDEKKSVFAGELSEILQRAQQRAKGRQMAIGHLGRAEQEANEYADKNLPGLKEQAAQEAKSAGKTVNPL